MHTLTSLILFLPLLTSHLISARAFSPWNTSPRENSEREQVEDPPSTLAATQARSRRDLDVLASGVTEKDCHTGVASRLSTRCGKDGGGMSERDRNAVAISMTVCSMLSASQAIPSECGHWAPSLDDSNVSSHSHKADTRPCLTVLHRSPQDWSTYLGFHREAVQLCLALDGRRQAELAQKTYVKATSDKLHLLDLLRRHEEEREEHQKSLRTSMDDHLAELRQNSHAADQILIDLAIQTTQQAKALQDFESALTTLRTTSSGVLNRMSTDASQQALEILADLKLGMDGINNMLRDDLSADLWRITQMHQETLDKNQEAFAAAMGSIIGASQQGVGSLTEFVARRMSDLGSDFDSLSLNVQANGEIASQTHEESLNTLVALKTSGQEMSRLLYTQQETTQSMAEARALSRSLTQELARSQDTVNATLIALSSWQLRLSRQSWYGNSLFSVLAPLLPLGVSRKIGAAVEHAGVAAHFLAFILQQILGLASLAISAVACTFVFLKAGMGRLLVWAGRSLVHDFRALVESLSDEEIGSFAQVRGPPAYSPPRKVKSLDTGMGLQIERPVGALTLNEETTLRRALESRASSRDRYRRAVSMPL